MKKTVISIAIVMTLALAIGLAFAQDEQETEVAEKKTPPKKNMRQEEAVRRSTSKMQEKLADLERKRPNRAPRGQRPGAEGREQVTRGMMLERQREIMDERIEKKQNEHNEFIKELEDIKLTAQAEEAQKTVEQLQKLIDKKNKAFAESIQGLRRGREKITERIKKQGETLPLPEPKPIKIDKIEKHEEKTK